MGVVRTRRRLDAAEARHRPTANYAKAMAAGPLALQGMIDDLDAGPREEVTEVRAPKHATFGFGFGFGSLK